MAGLVFDELADEINTFFGKSATNFGSQNEKLVSGSLSDKFMVSARFVGTRPRKRSTIGISCIVFGSTALEI